MGLGERERVIFKPHIFENKFLKQISSGGQSQACKDFITSNAFKRRQNPCFFLVQDIVARIQIKHGKKVRFYRNASFCFLLSCNLKHLGLTKWNTAAWRCGCCYCSASCKSSRRSLQGERCLLWAKILCRVKLSIAKQDWAPQQAVWSEVSAAAPMSARVRMAR